MYQMCYNIFTYFWNKLILQKQDTQVVAQLIRPWMCSPIVTSSSPLKVTYPKQSLVPIVVHVTSRVLHVPIGLVEVRVSTERWPRHLRL
jgi:hypothetical protein